MKKKKWINFLLYSELPAPWYQGTMQFDCTGTDTFYVSFLSVNKSITTGTTFYVVLIYLHLCFPFLHIAQHFIYHFILDTQSGNIYLSYIMRTIWKAKSA